MAAIQFSDDERTVTITVDGKTWLIHRPLVSPWNYTAGRTLWVDPAGNDGGDGSSASPFATIGKAFAAVGPGDIIYVRAGTYVEDLHLNTSGTSDAPIILSCAPGDLGQATITPSAAYVQANPSGAVITVQANHVWINGLVIEGPRGRPEAPALDTYGANGITWSGGAGQGCRATNNVVFHNVHCGMKEMGHGGTGILVEANVIFANGTESRDHGIYMPASGVTMNGNVIFENAGYGIHSYSAPQNQVIANNVCFGHAWAGIILAGGNNRVENNTCAYNGMGIMYFRSGCVNNVVKNNVFAFNNVDCSYDSGGAMESHPSGNTDDSNCYFPGWPAPQINPGPNNVHADPQFLDGAARDFQLGPSTPIPEGGAFPITTPTPIPPEPIPPTPTPTPTPPPLSVVSVAVNGGEVQRSMVTHLTVTLDGLVSVTAADFRLSRTGPGTPTGDVTLAASPAGGTTTQTVVRLTFLGTLTKVDSLIDGRYTLTVGGSTFALHRLFGDDDGDGKVGTADEAAFQQAYPSKKSQPNYRAHFDATADGDVDVKDQREFRRRVGVSL